MEWPDERGMREERERGVDEEEVDMVRVSRGWCRV